LVEYFAFFSSTEAVIDMIFINLAFSQKGPHLLVWEINFHSQTNGLNMAINTVLHLKIYNLGFVRFLFVIRP